jgi:hypothetical protein
MYIINLSIFYFIYYLKLQIHVNKNNACFLSFLFRLWFDHYLHKLAKKHEPVFFLNGYFSW